MEEIRGNNSCFHCGNNINWEARLNVPNGVPFILNGAQADLIAKGNLMTTNGKQTQFDVIVTCPKCKVKNKFEVVK